MKTLKKILKLAIFAYLILGIASCRAKNNSLSIHWVNTKASFVNGEPIVFYYYIENNGTEPIKVCNPSIYPKTLTYNMHMFYFEVILEQKAQSIIEGKKLEIDSIKDIANYAKRTMQFNAPHTKYSDRDSLFERCKVCRWTPIEILPKGRKYFEYEFDNQIYKNNSSGIDSKFELIAGDYQVTARIAFANGGYMDDSFVFSVYDRSPSQEAEYNELLQISKGITHSLITGSATKPKTIEDFCRQYPNSV